MREIWACGVVAALGMTSVARAQCTPGGPPNPPATPRTITGIVMDSAHNVLENAQVMIARPRRETRTSARGIFQLRDLDTGTYEITVRRIGHEIAVQKYIVTDSGGVARFCLFTEISALAPMITSVFRGGISGVIGDTALAMVRGAEVRVLGENKLAYSDSAGAFFFDVKPGRYTVVAKKKGYATQVIGVTVPKDSGRKVVVWLGSPARNPIAMANAIEGMRWNILMTPSFRYHRLTAEDLANNSLSLEQQIRVTGRQNVLDNCPVAIAGHGFGLPLYMIDKNDIALLEIVGAPLRQARSAPTSINGNKGIPLQRSPGLAPSRDCPGLLAFMKP
jgi:hypothetical protein